MALSSKECAKLITWLNKKGEKCFGRWKNFLKIPYNPHCLYTLKFQNYFLMFILFNFRQCKGIVPLESSSKEAAPHPHFTDQMCFVKNDMARNSEMHDTGVFLTIQIVQCKPNEICDPARESQYHGRGLGYVFCHCTCVILIRRQFACFFLTSKSLEDYY